MKNPKVLFADISELAVDALGGGVVMGGGERQALGASATCELFRMSKKCGRNALSTGGRIYIQIFKKPDGPHS